MNIKGHGNTLAIIFLIIPIGMGLGNYVGQDEPIKAKPIVKLIPIVKVLQGDTPATARKLAMSKLDDYGWSTKEWSCLNQMWGKESAWDYKAASPTKDHGIPQRHMSGKSKAEIHKFQSDPVAQINWGLGYIKHRYSTPCKAWSFWQANHWY